MGVLGPADEKRVVPVEYELLALMRSRDDGELHDKLLSGSNFYLLARRASEDGVQTLACASG
jgi:hypothetical protein